MKVKITEIHPMSAHFSDSEEYINKKAIIKKEVYRGSDSDGWSAGKVLFPKEKRFFYGFKYEVLEEE